MRSVHCAELLGEPCAPRVCFKVPGAVGEKSSHVGKLVASLRCLGRLPDPLLGDSSQLLKPNGRLHPGPLPCTSGQSLCIPISASTIMRFLRWLSIKECPCQGRRCRRHGFDPWLGKIPWKRKWHLTAVFFPAWEIPWTEEPGQLQSMKLQWSQIKLSD